MPYRELYFDRPGDAEQGKKEELETALPKIDVMLRELFTAASTIPLLASLEEAGLGVDNTKFMTPFLVKTAAILFAAEGVFDGGATYAAGTIGEALKLRATTTDTNAAIAAAIAALVDTAPGTLDTLNELAAALGDDPNFATTVTTALNNRVRTGATGRADMAPGTVVDSKLHRFVTYATGTTNMAGAADTIPQITDGTEITTVTFTPKDAANTLRVTVSGECSASAVGSMWSGLFRDATAPAKAARHIGSPVASTALSFGFVFEEIAGSAALTTFRLRHGNFTGDTSTWAINGVPAGRRLGGSQGLTILIEEIKG